MQCCESCCNVTSKAVQRIADNFILQTKTHTVYNSGLFTSLLLSRNNIHICHALVANWLSQSEKEEFTRRP